MRTRLVLLMTGVLATLAVAQPDEDFLRLTTGERPDCRNRVFMGSRRIMQYEGQGKPDSARLVNDALERYCGLIEPVARYRMLDAVRQQQAPLAGIEPALALDLLLDQRDRRKIVSRTRPGYNDIGRYFNYWADPNYDAFMAAWVDGATAADAKNGTATTDRDTMDARIDTRIVTAAYGEDWDTFRNLVRSQDSRSSLATEALRRRDGAYEGFRLHGSLFMGGWFPTGNLERANQHVYAGFKMGGGAGRFDLRFRNGLIFPNGPYRYTVGYDDTSAVADNFAGFSTALEPSWDLYRTLTWKASAVGSVGWTWAHAHTLLIPDEDNRELSVSSPDVAAGIVISRLWSQAGLTQFEVQYHLQNFRNPGGSSLRGNAITAQISIGLEANPAWMRARRIWANP
jgi:hypothetical protein